VGQGINPTEAERRPLKKGASQGGEARSGLDSVRGKDSILSGRGVLHKIERALTIPAGNINETHISNLNKGKDCTTVESKRDLGPVQSPQSREKGKGLFRRN